MLLFAAAAVVVVAVVVVIVDIVVAVAIGRSPFKLDFACDCGFPWCFLVCVVVAVVVTDIDDGDVVVFVESSSFAFCGLNCLAGG